MLDSKHYAEGEDAWTRHLVTGASLCAVNRELRSNPEGEMEGESTLGGGNSGCKGPVAGPIQEEIQCDRNIVGVMGGGGRRMVGADCVRPKRSRVLLDCILSIVGNWKG